MAQLVLGLAGAAVGSLVGMPQLGWAIGSALGGALTASQQKVTGPRLSDLKVTGTDYGQPIPWVAGTPRIAGQIWWASDRREVATSEQAGKGGGPTVTTYTYEVDLLIGLTDCEIGWVSRVWWNGKLVYNVTSTTNDSNIDASATTNYWRRLFVYTGSSDQLPDPVYEAAIGTADAPAYRNRGSVFIEGLQLGNSGQLPNLTFEIAISSVQQVETVLLMQFDGDIVDETGHPFTLSGTSTFSEGRFDQAIEMNGTAPGGGGNNLLYSSSTSADWDLNGGDFTMSCWVMFHGIPTRPRPLVVVTDNAGGAMNNFEYMIYNDGSSTKSIRAMFATGVAPNTDVIISDAAITTPDMLDRWFHVEFSRVGNLYNIFIDGQLQAATYVSSYRRAAGQKRIYIGNWETVGDALYGRIDGVRIVRGAALHTASFPVPTAPPGFATVLGVTTPLPSLSTVVESLCLRSGLSSEMFDVSELDSITKPVRALAVSQVGPTRATLEQLQTAYFFESSLSDKLYFRPRAGSPVATIPFSTLAAGRDEADPQPLAMTVASDLEVPAQVALQYSNVNDDYQVGTEYSDRLLSGQSSLNTVQLALGFTPAEAKGIADAVVADGAASLVSTNLSLPLSYARLEPSDVVTVVDQDGVSTYRVRLGRKEDEAGRIAFAAVIDDPTVVVSAEITDESSTSSETVTALAETVLHALDIPLLRDTDDGPGYYVAARGSTTNWPGAVALSSNDDVDYASVATVAESAVLGTCTTTLGAWTGGPVMDEVNSVTVNLAHGELASTTREALLASYDSNAMLIGSEVIRFVTAELLSADPNVYKLTRLLRGQRGTDWAMTGHASSERAVLLRMQGLRRVTQQAAEVGQLRYLKGVTSGGRAADVTADEFTPQSVSQKPFSPVDARAARAATSDVAITWKRRTRFASSFVGPSGSYVPLGEASEAYEVDVLATAGGTVRRTITTGSPACVYTATMQSLDFGGVQSTLYLKIYQVSAVAGRGYPLTVTLSAPEVSGDVGYGVFGMRPVMEIGGNLIAASIDTVLYSVDDGANFTLGADGSAQAYGTGVNYWDAQLGTQRISIGLSVYANMAGLIVASDDPMAANTQYHNNIVTEAWQTLGYPRVGAAVIGVGALYSDGTYYYIVGRLADQSQTPALMYLYRADATLVWSLQGQLQQGVDPNELAFNGYGSFNSSWFVPNSTTQSIYNQSSVLTQFSGRWFLRSYQAIYYTDDAAALTGWLRCPTGLAEGLVTTTISDLNECSATLLAISQELSGNCLAISTDNGETWATSRPIPQYGLAMKLVTFGSTALLYYTKNGVFSVASATSPFSTWTTAEVDGVDINDQLDAFVVTATAIVARRGDYTLVRSTDGITFTPVAIS